MNWFVPDQANICMVEAGVERFGCNPERVLVSLDKFGNTSAASVPIAIDLARQNKQIRRGQKLLMVAFGADLTAVAVILRWSSNKR
jgi:3-oxoacyl-[acyl-carrier-protein] synthase-3